MSGSGYHHGDLRRVLVGIAHEAVVDGALKSLTMRWLTAQAGVSVAAAYHHFTDRTELLWAVAEAGFDELLLRLRSALDGTPRSDGSPSRLLRLGAAYVTFACERRPLYRLMMQACRDEAYRPYRHEAGAWCCFTLLRDEVREAGLASDPQDEFGLALGVWAAMHGAADLEIEIPVSCGGAERAADLCRRLLPALLARRKKTDSPTAANSGDDHD